MCLHNVHNLACLDITLVSSSLHEVAQTRKIAVLSVGSHRQNGARGCALRANGGHFMGETALENAKNNIVGLEDMYFLRY